MMKRKTAVALWIAFVAALGLGYGCNSSDNNTPPESFSLDGTTYTEKFTCNEQFGGVPPTTCPDNNEVDVIAWSSTGPNKYEGVDVPDTTGFRYTGTLSGTVLTWTAILPGEYTESGTWTFSASGDMFSGSSHYTSVPGHLPPAYSGDCNTNGVVGTANTPPDPPPPTGCPP